MTFDERLRCLIYCAKEINRVMDYRAAKKKMKAATMNHEIAKFKKKK